jgi:ABC-2 type transport system ATP-binding protein
MIRFEHVTHRFGRKTAVDGLDLSIAAGELFALLGRNGAGKTTTIKLLVGLLRPTSGRILVDGKVVEEDPCETNRLIGYVPDQPQLYEKLTGREFLQFVGQMYGLAGAQLREAIDGQIAQFRLADFVDQLTESYSYGMKQRTVFAAAMLHAPQVIVVDEPLVGLDPHSIRLVKDLLVQCAGGGAAVLVSTHTLAVAEEIADRIGIIDRGRLLFEGTLPALRHHMQDGEATLEDLYLSLIERAEAGRVGAD